ncbi:hypothetical protein CBS101457_006335 [Exobasidium rhododendri]|nr:hypothetical protein CBS101457_006335 [Exobasidium rhododendri]
MVLRSGSNGVPSGGEEDEVKTATQDAIARSRTFLEAKLVPDLEQTTELLRVLELKRDNYTRLQEVVKSMNTPEANHSEREVDEDEKIISSLANLGQGVHLPVEIQSDALMIVSLGLGTKESSQGWASDSGLYVQLTPREASQFSMKKVELIAK